MGISQDDSGVLVEAKGQTFRGGRLIGCDGGSSVVRKDSGFEFVGTDSKRRGHLAHIGPS